MQIYYNVITALACEGCGAGYKTQWFKDPQVNLLQSKTLKSSLNWTEQTRTQVSQLLHNCASYWFPMRGNRCGLILVRTVNVEYKLWEKNDLCSLYTGVSRGAWSQTLMVLVTTLLQNSDIRCSVEDRCPRSEPRVPSGQSVTMWAQKPGQIHNSFIHRASLTPGELCSVKTTSDHTFTLVMLICLLHWRAEKFRWVVEQHAGGRT